MEEHLDLEIVRELLTRFYALSREILERHGGTVEKFIGDAVVSVFGVPRTHEDDALRAARSAIELRDTVARTNDDLRDRYGVALRLRIGVNTGEVIVGDPSESPFVSGDAVNVAARLEQVAQPGSVLIGEDTYGAAQRFVRVEQVQSLSLKGKSEPVRAYRLLGVSDYSRNRPIGSPLVGRDRDIASLQGALRRVQGSATPGMLLVLGEPGIGKSRLVNEFLRTAEDIAKIVETRCTVDEDVPWRPVFAEAVRLLLGLSGETDVDEVTDRVVRVVGQSERAPLVAAKVVGLVGLGPVNSFDDSSWALRELLGVVGAQRTVILSIDDLQWGGLELLEFLRCLLDLTRGRVLVIGSAHPEFVAELGNAAPWIGERAERLNLRPLERHDALLMAEHLLGARLDEPGAEAIVDACGGNPLFLLESVLILRDRRAPRGDGKRLDEFGNEWMVPSSIKSIIAARLDLLGDLEREVLCIAAVIGLVVDVEDLRAVALPETLEGLDRCLQRLVDRQLLQEQRSGALQFPHTLVRKVAYETLTKEIRTQLHVACADRRESQGDLPGAGSHLERAYQLRRSLGLNDEWAGTLAFRAAADLGAAGLSSIDRLDRLAAVGFEQRASNLSAAFHHDVPAQLSELSFRLGAWDDVVALLDHGHEEELSPDEAHRLGMAILKRTGRENSADDVARGRRLLDQAGKAGDTDALVALAGTWRGVDDGLARSLYRAVLEIDPAEPYALGNFLEYEIEQAKLRSVVKSYRSAIEKAIERRAAQTSVGRDVPWSWFDLGKFQLLLGTNEEAYRSFAAGVLTSTAAYMPSSALGSIERLALYEQELPGSGPVRQLLRLSAVASFGTAPGSITDLATADGSRLSPPVLILAGASGVTSSIVVSRVRAPLLAALASMELTLVSGGTTSGVSALAGDVAAAFPSIRTVGYLPPAIDHGSEHDVRYTELRTTGGWTFGPQEPLRYWADVLTSGIDPRDVRMLAVGGGRVSGIEYRTALALGAQVAVLNGSGGAASALMRDPAWALSDRLIEVSPAEDDIGSFLAQKINRGPGLA